MTGSRYAAAEHFNENHATSYFRGSSSAVKSSAQEDQVKELEERVEQLKQKCKDLKEEHDEEIREEREKWKRNVADLKDEHADAIQLLRTEHTLLVDQVLNSTTILLFY